MLRYTLKVIYIKKETEDAVTISFKQPALKKIKYLPGQYLTLIVNINGRRYLRPYSLSSSPNIDATLDVTVKRVIGGIVSNHLIDRVNEGDTMEVIEPMGDFVLERIPNIGIQKKKLVLWGSGSGITPLMSIAKYALNSEEYDHVTLVYGNRSFETTIFKEQLNSLQTQYPKTFSIWHFHTKETIGKDNPYVIQGRINPKKALDILSFESKLENTFHYICGPTGLKDSIKSVLFSINVQVANVFSEDFEIIRNPKDFEDVLTQNVTFKIDNNVSLVEVTKGKSILEAGLDAMLNLSYSCQTGSCLLCKAKLVNGRTKTIGIEKLPDELHSDECLLCCSFPVSDDVEILVKNQ